MKTIQLTQGQVALVDDADYEWLNKFKWCAQKYSKNKFYAITSISISNTIHKQKQKQKHIKMHRLILGLTNPNIKGDHINGNGLDNQKHNLRNATNSQNTINSKLIKPNETGYIGVRLTNRKKSPYRVGIMHLGKHFSIGSFSNIIDAAKAYDIKAKELHGEFAKSNFK